MNPIDGVLPVDKPEGPTSHDIVTLARRSLGERRIGHTGTLDPFASGLLLLCIGRATRLAEFLTGLDKSYEAVAKLGVATDTEDRLGSVVSESADWRDLSRAQIEAGLAGFLGDTEQVPPQFSAKKVGGEAVHARMHTRGEFNDGRQNGYALGVAMGAYRGLPTVEHGGALGGYRSHLLRFPDQEFAVVILAVALIGAIAWIVFEPTDESSDRYEKASATQQTVTEIIADPAAFGTEEEVLDLLDECLCDGEFVH